MDCGNCSLSESHRVNSEPRPPRRCSHRPQATVYLATEKRIHARTPHVDPLNGSLSRSPSAPAPLVQPRALTFISAAACLSVRVQSGQRPDPQQSDGKGSRKTKKNQASVWSPSLRKQPTVIEARFWSSGPVFLPQSWRVLSRWRRSPIALIPNQPDSGTKRFPFGLVPYLRCADGPYRENTFKV